MSKNFEIDKCVFCGSEEIGVRKNLDGCFSVRCNKCNAEGPTADTAQESVEKWNNVGAQDEPELNLESLQSLLNCGLLDDDEDEDTLIEIKESVGKIESNLSELCSMLKRAFQTPKKEKLLEEDNGTEQ